MDKVLSKTAEFLIPSKYCSTNSQAVLNSRLQRSRMEISRTQNQLLVCKVQSDSFSKHRMSTLVESVELHGCV